MENAIEASGIRQLNRRALIAGAGAALVLPNAAQGRAEAQARPLIDGWYADPEIRIFANRYWIYPTYSADRHTPAPPSRLSAWQREQRRAPHIWAPFLRQTFLDAFSSPDLVHWTRHPRVLDVAQVGWAAYAMWAPSAINHRGRYYLFFGANDLKSDAQVGGIGVAVATRPEGPFRDAIGRPLIGTIEQGAQPIDQMVFRDDDGSLYLYYGGWKHCNVARLSDDCTAIRPFADGSRFKSITPSPDYVEGPFMAKRDGVYYLMWSENDWTGPDYRVAYATAPGPLGPFTPRGVILQQDARIARGAGHHSLVRIPGSDDWYIVYHRRPLGERDGNHREIAIDRLHFRRDGSIAPVVMTAGGVGPRPLPC